MIPKLWAASDDLTLDPAIYKGEKKSSSAYAIKKKTFSHCY